MSGVTLQRLSTLTLNIKQFKRLPRFLDLFPPCPSSPSPTVLVSQVPSLFQEPFILSGYRPVGQDWRCYLLSLFQRHNESLNVWTHLLACPVLLLRWWAYMGAAGHTWDVTSLPLCLYVLSSLTYLLCSVVAHLWQSHSELSHYSLFFLDYVGVAVYQYGCSLGHYFYSSEPAWRENGIGVLFLPGAAFLAWLSCYGCCYAKSRYQRPYPLRRKICQLIPTCMAYVLDISPVVHRLTSVPWAHEPAMPFHALQVALFLLAAFFFSCPVPECFLPGRCDFVGQGHQIFHLLLSLCTLSQLEALLQDHTRRRDSIMEVFGERQLWWACVSFPVLVLCCSPDSAPHEETHTETTARKTKGQMTRRA